MSDKSEDINREQINVKEPIGLKAWAARFGFNEDEVVTAVEAVGTHAADVNRHLKATIKKVMSGAST